MMSWTWRRRKRSSDCSVHLQSSFQPFTAVDLGQHIILRSLKSPVGFGGRKKVAAESFVVDFNGVTHASSHVRFSFLAATRSAPRAIDAAGAVAIANCFVVRYQTNVQQQNHPNELQSYTAKCHHSVTCAC